MVLNSTASDKKIVFVVNNPGTTDGRVMKSALLARQMGHDVHLLGTLRDGFAREEVVKGITVKRVTPYSFTARNNTVQKHDPGEKAGSSKISFVKFWTVLKNVVFALIMVMLKITGGRAFLQQFIHMRTFEAPLKAMSPEIIHCHDMWPLGAAMRVKRETGAKLIFDSHELEAHRNIDWGKIERMVWTHYEAQLLKRVDGVVTVCDSIARVLEPKTSGKHVRVVYNSPWKEWTKARYQADVRSDCGISKETPLLLYVGYVTYNRGVELLLAALELMPDAHFAIVGPTREATVRELQSIAEAKGLLKRVHFLPGVAQKDVVPYISTADVSGVLFHNSCLSHYYVLPNKFFESVFAGVPVVVPDFPELQRHVKEFNVGIVCSDYSPQTLARCLAKGIRLKKAEGWENSAKGAQGTWAYDNFLEDMRELYSSLENSN